MENDAKMNVAEDTLGADNADILAAKRKRSVADAQGKQNLTAVSASSLHAQMNAAQRPRVQRASSVSNTPPKNAPKPTAALKAKAPSKPATAQKSAVAVKSTAAPKATPSSAKETKPEKPVSPRVQSAAFPTEQTSATRAKVHAIIPHQNASVPAGKKSPDTEQTRVTNLQTVKVGATVMDQTRISNVQPVVLQRGKESHEEDESEGGNAILSVIKAITYIVSVIVVSVFLASFIILVGNDIYAFVKDEAVVQLTVPENATVDDIATLLHENGVIEYPTVFKLYAKYKAKDDGVFLAGEYTDLTPMMNYDELLAAFKPKKPSGTSRITIPEGYTTDEIIDLFLSYGIGTREGFVDVINNYDFDYWFIDALEENGVKDGRYYRLDGYLFPDTYEFYNASSEEVVIGKLLRRFNEVFVESYRQKAADLGYSVDEILTIASMVEKEGGTQADFFDISSVFNNRLKNASAYPYLESDATIVYAIRHETGEHITPTAEDLSYDSPYNTYLNSGLPPGPIANPSASAIRAALYPSDTKYYFFVSASSSVTYYASTKAEHEANIQKIRDAAQSGQ